MSLQSIVDATIAEMHRLKSTVAELTDRQAALAADRAKAAATPASSVAEGDGVRYAYKCVADIVAGFGNFDNEQPQVQALLQQLAVAIDAACGMLPPRDAKQQSIREAFARQAPVTQHYEIASENVTPQAGLAPPRPEAVPSPGPVSMEVAGECPGGKRKLEHLAPAPPNSNAGDITSDERETSGDVVCESPMVGSSSAQPQLPESSGKAQEPQPVESTVPGSTHEALRKQLMTQNEKHIQSRKARTETTKRSMPY